MEERSGLVGECSVWSSGGRSYTAGARAWPTLVLIDPLGYVVFATAGEQKSELLEAVNHRGRAGSRFTFQPLMAAFRIAAATWWATSSGTSRKVKLS